MNPEQKYTFVPLAQKNYAGFHDKATQELLMKWGLKGNIVIQNFSFNEPFQPYQRYNLAEAFFEDEAVTKELITKLDDSWIKRGISGKTVEAKQIPCSVLSMSFFNKLKDPENKIIQNSGMICKRYDSDIDGFLVADNLRGMLLDEECDEYNLYTEDEREQFVFRIFQMVVLGGKLCQYEDALQPYLDVTKSLYKDLVRVEKAELSNDLSITTMVLEVVARDREDRAYFPVDPYNRQNIGFLLVDGSCRQITTFLHQFGGCEYTY